MKNLMRSGALFLALVLALSLAVPAYAAVEDTGFSDLDAGAWYAEAVMYCRQHNLMNGVGNNRFAPESSLTREQMITVLWRYAGSPKVQGGNYSDAAEIASYAVTAAAWAHSEQIVRPVSGDVFAPKSAATRAQAADMLMRYDRSTQTEPTVSDSLALINGGTFQMGSPANEPERSSDEIQHTVTVSSFYMTKTEVSQAEYQAVMGSNPSDTKGDDLPVTNITWYDAIEYCNRRSESEGLTPCYTISGTTVTWNKSAYGYNNDASGSWVNGSDAYLRHTVAVDNYNANAYGLYNMHGNAAEWVWDWYGAYDAQASSNPTGPEGGNAKIVRDGGWNDHPKHIRSAYRGAQPADVGLYSIGIRPVRNAGATSGQVTSTYTAQVQQKTGKTLIVYFSQTGNTEGLANLIHEMSGFDIFRLERATPYSSSSNGPVLYGEALNELRAEAVPELKVMPDLSQYDTILLGYCNWWSSIPACVRTLLTRNDLSGKTIVPFCSMGGGRFGQTISAIAKLAPNSVIKEGLEVTYSSYDRAEIQAWLDNSLPHDTPEGGNKTLIAYFSATNNTESIAGHIKTALGDEADVYEILAETPYTSADLNYSNSDCRANREQNDPNARPAFSGSVDNMEQYDVIFLGYPIWWGQAPKIMYTFVESYNLSGKTIVPFCTSGSSGIGSSATNLQNNARGGSAATWLSGSRFSGSASQSAVANWVNGLDLPKQEDSKMYIQVSGAQSAVWTATLVENSSTAALKELLKSGPLTIQMSDYNNFEKWGPIGQSLPTNDEQISTEAGDIILYQGSNIAIYYDHNDYNFTRLGKVDGVTQTQMKTVLGTGNVTVTMSLAHPAPCVTVWGFSV